MSETIHSHIWYPDNTGNIALLKDQYDDQRDGKRLITTGSLPSKFVDNGFLELFISYSPRNDNKVLEEICPDFEPFHESGMSSDIRLGMQDAVKSRGVQAADTALVCLTQLYEIKINDSLHFENTFRFHRHGNSGEYGIITLIDVDYLERGEHVVKVNRWHKGHKDNKDSLVIQPRFQIPFWVE